MKDRHTTVIELKERIKRFCEDREWDRYHNAKDLAIGISTEASELLEIFRFKSEKEAEEMFGNIGAIAKLGEIMTGSQKEANTWKERMIKAGLGAGIQMPEDWNTLPEDEKEARLNKEIEFMKPKKKEKKHYGKTNSARRKQLLKKAEANYKEANKYGEIPFEPTNYLSNEEGKELMRLEHKPGYSEYNPDEE